VLWNGFNLERWFERFFENVKDVPSVVVTEGIDPVGITEGPYTGKPNPHAWMSPSNALIYVENIRKALVKHDPANADTYNRNAAAYSAQIKAADEPLRKRLSAIPENQRWLVSSEGAFSYLTRDYNMKEAYLWPINADEQGTPQQVRKVIDLVRKNKIPVVFSESTISDRAAKQVARAVVTALMTAFYMFRLMSMTFFGAYRGPAWEHATPAAAHVAAVHGVPHPADPHAHGQAHRADHEVTHGPADAAAHDPHGGHGHGHGAWHGPHESPRPMTVPLMALAVGAVVAGFVSIPPALGGSAALEHFLETSLTSHAGAAAGHAEGTAPEAAAAAPTEAAEAAHEEPEVSHAAELGLMLFSVMIAAAGIWTAYRFYVQNPETADQLKDRYAGAHNVLYNKYYVDELYDATFVSGTMKSAFGLWGFDRRVVDGAVNGSGWLTVFASWVSGLFDRYIVDGAVNLVGRSSEESSFVFRRVQTGLIQNYALLMLAGVFAFVSIYLLVR
jgi:hypothetical protein